MKKISLLPGIILLGIGIFYSIQKLNIHLFEYQTSWQVVLIILGAAYLISGHFEKDNSAILPGIILAGLGLHFIYIQSMEKWPSHPAAFLFILSIGMLLTSAKTKGGYGQGAIVLSIGLFLHFFQSIVQVFSVIENGNKFIEGYWPFLFVLLGAILVYLKRKR